MQRRYTGTALRFSDKYRAGTALDGSPLGFVVRNPWVKTIITHLGVYAAGGLVGNRFDAGIVNGALWIFDYLSEPQVADTRTWFVGFALAAYLILAFLISYRQAVFIDLDNAVAELNRSKEQLARAKNSNSELSKTNTALQSELDTVRSEFSTLKPQLTNLTTQNERLQAQVLKFTGQNIELLGENHHLHDAVAVQESARGRLEHLVELDLYLLAFLAPLLSMRSHERDKAMRALLKKVLSDVTKVFQEDVCRAHIWRPGIDVEYLEWWEHHGMPKAALRNDRFYIGEGKTVKRGIAAIAFRTKEPQVVHISKIGSQYHADHAEFSFRRGSMKPMDYSSVVVVPIIGPNDDCLGVLCLDSKRSNTFDQPETLKFLDDLATRLATAISTYHYIEAVEDLESAEDPDSAGSDWHNQKQAS
jgi:hypothetical protein